MKIIPLSYWIEEEFEKIRKFIESAHPILGRSIGDEIESIARLYPNIYNETKNKVIQKSLKIAEEIKAKMGSIRNEVKQKIEIKKSSPSLEFMEKPVIGCDTSSNVMPISTARLYTVSGISAYIKDKEIKEVKTLTDIIDSERISEIFECDAEIDLLEGALSDEFFGFEDVEIRFIVSALREAYLCELAKRHLEEVIDDGENVYAMVIDGPLSISQWYEKVPGTVRKKAVEMLINARNELMETCRKNDVALLGIVKRGRGRYFHHLLGISQLSNLSDQSLFHQILDYGERTETLSVTEGIRIWRKSDELKRAMKNLKSKEKIKAKEKEIEEKVKSNSLLINRLRYEILGFFIKTSTDELTQPIRIEFPSYLKDRDDEISDFIISTSVRSKYPAYINGLPFAVAVTHVKARISSMLMREIYSHTLAKVYQDFKDLRLLPPEWGERPW